MEAILTKLEKTREQLVKKANERDSKFVNRSEKWQNSEKGAAYEVNTSLIADIVQNLDDAIENAKLFLK
ncbi:hypothetical protein [Tenacibaculum mesophilum]|uniref:hypothetical protein n=1 Tax=Tenacibaculum mesophilum TaxID=104268 RepID=UPI00064B3186|nr:hypothetical protein [Tenacibaculum mesophilum]